MTDKEHSERKMAVRGLFYEHYGDMMRYATSILYSEEEAEDVVQDVFMKMMEVERLPESGKARTYLMTAVRNGSLNRIRQKSVTKRDERLYPIEACDKTDSGEGQMEVCEVAEMVLQEPHRSIFRLRFGEDMKLKEIAESLDMNIKTVFKYLGQAIKSIKKEFCYEQE